ncbi:MAG TPA: lytic transglycosylase domain-containing protein, partial [Nannocystaceae bacterium]|nr:lytic transglycosylase domain-containing protein [Nannocystaceae bacterium]
FPPDVLGVELALAQLELAKTGGAAAKDADRELEKGIALLRKLERYEPIRNLAQMEVLQAQMYAATSDGSGARRAVASLEDVLQAYPHHPERGRLWLEHARALERSGRTKDAMAELRSIAIERTGEPESDEAWTLLETLSAAHDKPAPKFSASETLARASAARRNKRADVSRELLEGLIVDPSTPAHIEDQAERSRSATAAKQRDYATCAADLRPVFAKTGNFDVRDSLLKCLERGGFYDEAIDMWLADAKAKKKSNKAHAIWEAIELAVRGGKYKRARELIGEYEKDKRWGKGHGQERTWLKAWIAMRLGEDEAAIAWFAAVESKYRSEAKRARYFRGKLMLESEDAGERARGETLLRAMASSDSLGYYGLQARQRLLDAELAVPAVPKIAPVKEEIDPPRRPEAQAVLDDLTAKYGAAWPPITRAKQLYEAGYNDEARRELRVAVQAFLTRGKKAKGPRNEDVLVGLGWKANWKFPRVSPTKAGRKMLRDRDAVEDMRVGLRKVAFALQEPHAYVKLSTPREASLRSRWTLRAFRPAVEREARLRKIDPKHMWALMYTESRFRPHVVSPVGARGALQIMPSTANQLAERLGETDGHFFDTDRLFDIDTNAHLSAYYVAELLAKFHGQAPMAYASYNGGPSNVARWLSAKSVESPLELDVFVEEIPFSESYRYTKRVMEVHATYAALYDGDLPRWNNTVDPKFEDNIDF